MRGGREHAWKRAALLLAAGAAAAGGCAWAVQGKLTTAWYEVPLPAGLEGLDGVKIAQISDVHSADLERPLGAALAAAAPDLIVMTGDLVNREDRELSRALSLARMAAYCFLNQYGCCCLTLKSATFFSDWFSFMRSTTFFIGRFSFLWGWAF